MAKMDDVVPNEVIESAWGNAIRDRSVQRMTSEADRDTSYPAPVAGDIVFVDGVDELQYWDGDEWRTLVTADGDVDMDGVLTALGFANTLGNAQIHEDGSISGISATLEADTLPSTTDSYVKPLDVQVVDGNSEGLTGVIKRVSSGSDHNTTASVLSRLIDATYMGGVAFDTSDAWLFTQNGAIPFDGLLNYLHLTSTLSELRRILVALDGAYIDTYSPAPPAGGDLYGFQIRNVIVSETIPSSGTGNDGDVCFQYTFAGSAQNTPANVWVKVQGLWRGMT